jgi:hypothetical protein
MKRRNLDLDECFRTETERYHEGSVALLDSVESQGDVTGLRLSVVDKAVVSI